MRKRAEDWEVARRKLIQRRQHAQAVTQRPCLEIVLLEIDRVDLRWQDANDESERGADREGNLHPVSAHVYPHTRRNPCRSP